MNKPLKLFLILTTSMLAIVPAATAQQRGDDRTILIRGCVNAAGKHAITPNRSLLVWSKGDISLSSVSTEMTGAPGSPNGQPNVVAGTAGSTQTMFYWLEDTGDIEKHVGEMVEITGRLGKDIDRAKIAVDPKDHFTEVEFDSNGHEVKARVPAGMLGETSKTDFEYRVVIRDVDVRNVRRLSRTCQP